MKSLVRNVSFYGFSLFLLTVFLSGVRVSGGFPSYLVGGIVLTLLFFLVKPVISLISFPLNLISLGLFSFVTNALMLYILTVLVPSITIRAFEFSGLSFGGFIIPRFFLNTFFAFIVSSFILSLIMGFLTWLTKK